MPYSLVSVVGWYFWIWNNIVVCMLYGWAVRIKSLIIQIRLNIRSMFEIREFGQVNNVLAVARSERYVVEFYTRIFGESMVQNTKHARTV